MKVVNRYQCEVCNRQYMTEEQARACEARPVVHDRGVKIGDIVRITGGEATGKLARVTSIGIHEPGWGPARYDHSVFVTGDIIDSWGSRLLCFDSYEVMK